MRGEKNNLQHKHVYIVALQICLHSGDKDTFTVRCFDILHLRGKVGVVEKEILHFTLRK